MVKRFMDSTTAETKEALGKLQEMYKNGALDQELGVRKDADEAWKSGQAGIFFYHGGSDIIWQKQSQMIQRQHGYAMRRRKPKTDSGIPKLGSSNESVCGGTQRL